MGVDVLLQITEYEQYFNSKKSHDSILCLLIAAQELLKRQEELMRMIENEQLQLKKLQQERAEEDAKVWGTSPLEERAD